MIWTLVLGFLKSSIGPVFDFLNKRVDANARIHLSDNETMQRVGSTVIEGASKADELNAQIRMKGEKFLSPMVVFMASVLAPLVWHEWQVVMDSSRFIPAIGWAWGFIPYPSAEIHIIGSWRVAALPPVWEVTEQAIFQSLFIGASTAVAGIALIKAVRR